MHGDAGRRLDVARGHVAGALLAQVHADRLVVLGADAQLLDVHDQLDHVLLDTGDRGELVQHAVDLDAGDGRARDRAEQRTPQRVAERVAEARLQRLDGEPGPGLVDRLFGEGRSLGDEHCRSLFVRGARYLTPTSTMCAGEPAATTGAPRTSRLLGVELDDQLLLDLGVDDLRGPGASGPGSSSGWGWPPATPARSASRPGPARPRTGSARATSPGPARCRARVTRYDGMSTFLPLTRKWPCLTSWRAMSRDLA